MFKNQVPKVILPKLKEGVIDSFAITPKKTSNTIDTSQNNKKQNIN
jgi:hypothetical protein